MTKREKLLLLGSLYLSQGLPFGFFTQALPVILRQRGASLPFIGLTSLLALPWALKFLWAPAVDRWGRRKSWIVPLQVAATLLLATLAFINLEQSVVWLMTAVLLTNLLAATQDIATDGLAVDLLGRDERGLGNGVQVAGYRLGMILGGGALLVVYSDIGQRGVFLAMAAMLGLATIPILRHEEHSRVRRSVASPRLWSFVRQPGMLPWMALLVLFKIGDALASSMIRPWMVDAGQSMRGIGLILGAGGFSTGLLGALLGGLGVEHFGRRRALLGFGVVHAMALLGYGAAAKIGAPTWAIVSTSLFEHLTGGLAIVALFTLMMDVCRDESRATDYTAQASIVVFATGAGASLGGYSAAALGYPGHFLLGAIIQGAGVVLAVFVRPPVAGLRDSKAESPGTPRFSMH